MKKLATPILATAIFCSACSQNLQQSQIPRLNSSNTYSLLDHESNEYTENKKKEKDEKGEKEEKKLTEKSRYLKGINKNYYPGSNPFNKVFSIENQTIAPRGTISKWNQTMSPLSYPPLVSDALEPQAIINLSVARGAIINNIPDDVLTKAYAYPNIGRHPDLTPLSFYASHTMYNQKFPPPDDTTDSDRYMFSPTLRPPNHCPIEVSSVYRQVLVRNPDGITSHWEDQHFIGIYDFRKKGVYYINGVPKREFAAIIRPDLPDGSPNPMYADYVHNGGGGDWPFYYDVLIERKFFPNSSAPTYGGQDFSSTCNLFSSAPKRTDGVTTWGVYLDRYDPIQKRMVWDLVYPPQGEFPTPNSPPNTVLTPSGYPDGDYVSQDNQYCRELDGQEFGWSAHEMAPNPSFWTSPIVCNWDTSQSQYSFGAQRADSVRVGIGISIGALQLNGQDFRSNASPQVINWFSTASKANLVADLSGEEICSGTSSNIYWDFQNGSPANPQLYMNWSAHPVYQQP